MSRRIGYARVSTDDQDLAIQKTALENDDCAIVFEEKRSARSATAAISCMSLELISGSSRARGHSDIRWPRILWDAGETDVRRERQGEGIVKAKKAGVYTGAKPRLSRDEVLELQKGGQGPSAAARALGPSRMSIYRIIRESRMT